MIPLQCLIGLQCNDFVMIAADQINALSILVMKHDEHKLFEMSDCLLMGVVGNSGDVIQFTQFLSKNLHLYQLKNGYELDTAAAVHFARKNMVDRIKGGTPSLLNLLVGGCDPKEGCQLYSVDEIATCIKVPFAVHGLGGLVSLGILNHYYNNALTEAEAYAVLKMCVRQIHERLIISLPNFEVKVISRSGIRELPPISPASFLTGDSMV